MTLQLLLLITPVAYVVDDPMAAFKVAVVYANSVVTTVNQSVVGINMAIDQGTGSTTTGNSGAGVLVPTDNLGNAATLPVRAVSVVPETATGTNAFTEVVVKLNNPQILLSVPLKKKLSCLALVPPQ